MPKVRDIITGLTGVVTREYGTFKSGMLVQGLPIPAPLKESPLYQRILNTPEASDPIYEKAAKRLADYFILHKGLCPGELIWNYVLTHDNFFLTPEKKKDLLEFLVSNNLVIKPVTIGADGKPFDADEDGVDLFREDQQVWDGYRVIVWGELPSPSCKDRPPVVHYFKLDCLREMRSNAQYSEESNVDKKVGNQSQPWSGENITL